MVRVILTDIEGTTSSISFVKDVLFPYAARAMPAFLRDHWNAPEVQEAVAAVQEMTPDADVHSPEAVDRILQRWIEEDRKATPLKALQGMIWKAGYESGAYRAHLYPDTAPALRQWHALGIRLCVYSSGSVPAQKLFFQYSEAGDLTPLFDDYFDTRVGGKQDPASYREIATAIGEPANAILFLSDVVAELDAARACGMRTIQLDRDGSVVRGAHPVVTSFAAIDPAALPTGA